MTPEQLREHLYGKWDVRDTIRRREIRDAEDKDVEDACAKYRRHTMDVSGPAPRFVEDEMLAVERGYRRAKWMWAIIIVVVTGLVVMRISFGGDQ